MAMGASLFGTSLCSLCPQEGVLLLLPPGMTNPNEDTQKEREREKTLGGLYRMKKRSYLGIHIYTSRGGERETMRLNGLYTCTGHKQELGVKENCL